jgi:hypothetical protein
MRAAMSKDFRIVQFTIDEEVLKKAGSRLRNQVVGCMHAHNELTVLNRLLMFSMNKTADGELHDSTQSVQMWCLLQVLAGKLVETWNMLNERFLKAKPEDPALARIGASHKGSLDWLKDYFGVDQPKDNALRMIRDKTAFHYDKLNLEQALSNFAEHENTVYLAQHPANSVYYAGSVLVFRTAFAMIADSTQDRTGSTFGERTVEGVRITIEDVSRANWHMHMLLYGLIGTLLEEMLACPLETLEQVRINVQGAPNPAMVGLPTFIDIGESKASDIPPGSVPGYT